MTRSSTDSVVAVPSANDPAGDQQLRRLLHAWSLTAVAVRQPGYYEELTAARAGTATTVPVTEAIPGWAMAEVIDYPTTRSGPSRPAIPTCGEWSSARGA